MLWHARRCLSRRLCFYYRQVGFAPLPEKKDTGGEDAFLSTSSVQAVLDGVSWWRDNAQVNAGLYSAAVARSMYDYIEDDLLGDIPASSFRLLEKGYQDCKHSDIQGTCTALVATLQERQLDIQAKDGYTMAELDLNDDASATDAVHPAGGSGKAVAAVPITSHAEIAGRPDDPTMEGCRLSADGATNHLLDVVYVGDCSLVLVREGRAVFASEEQQHDLDYPFQLGTGSNDTPTDGIRLLLPVRKGDILVIGSDGLFDNVYTSRVAELVWSTMQPVYKAHHYPRKDSHHRGAAEGQTQHNKLVEEMMRALQNATNKVVEEALVKAHDIRADTPYASRCIEGGAMYEGGKPDDVTCLVSIIGEEDDAGSGERFSGGETAYPLPYRDWP